MITVSAKGIKELVDVATSVFGKANQGSITQRVKDATIVSRVYIEDSLANEDVMLDLIGTINQLYVCYIMTALGLEQRIDGARSIRDIVSTISTESLVDAVEVSSKFGTVNMDEKVVSLESAVVGQEPNAQHLVAGKVIEFSFGTENGKSVNIYVYMQLIPKLIDATVAGAFLSLNMPADVQRRLSLLKAGQISFWKDFIFARDRVTEYQNALKADKNGALTEILARQQNSLRKYWMSLTGLKDNYNSASSVLIIDKNTLEKAKAEHGFKFTVADQNRFFRTSYMLMVAVVDPMYNTVELYINGLEGVGQYSFAELAKLSSGKGGMDLKDVMAVFSRGSVGRI